MIDATIAESIRRLWRLPEDAPRRGRKSVLDTRTIVDTAVGLADEGGLEAATLPRVAERLGVTAMSLYRHVGSKHELLELMMDGATPPPADPPERGGWREGLWGWALEMAALYERRAWLPRVPIYRPPAGPNQIAWLERGFSHLASTGLEWDEKVTAMTLLSGHVRHYALLHHELREGRAPNHSQSESEEEYGRALEQMIDPALYPQTATMLETGLLGGSPTDPAGDVPLGHDFADGLELILDGLAVRVSGAGR